MSSILQRYSVAVCIILLSSLEPENQHHSSFDNNNNNNNHHCHHDNNNNVNNNDCHDHSTKRDVLLFNHYLTNYGFVTPSSILSGTIAIADNAVPSPDVEMADSTFFRICTSDTSSSDDSSSPLANKKELCSSRIRHSSSIMRIRCLSSISSSSCWWYHYINVTVIIFAKSNECERRCSMASDIK